MIWPHILLMQYRFAVVYSIRNFTTNIHLDLQKSFSFNPLLKTLAARMLHIWSTGVMWEESISPHS